MVRPESALTSTESAEHESRGFSIPGRVEWAIYAGLVAIALVMRVYDLGSMAVHHDESLHGYFAFQIFNGAGYDHNPLMHGMFLFHSIATSFFLFGDSEASMRLPMALFGVGLVLVPLILRPRLGQFGALAAAFLLTFSPALLYYSRFARNDIFMAVFTLALVGAMWRYLDEKKNRWLYLAAALVALGFTTKETQYLVIAILGSYLLIRTWQEIRDWLYARRMLSEFSPEASFMVLIGTFTLPVLAASSAIFQNMIGFTLAAEDGTPGVAVGSPNGGGWSIAIGVSAAFLAAALTIGWYWKRNVFLIAFGIFVAVFILIFSNFGSNPGGVITGAWQSLGYWLAQQDVARGNQPWYYYFMIGSVYEFLPFSIATVATIYYMLRSGIRPWIATAIAVVGMVVLAIDSVSFTGGIVRGEEKDVLTTVGTAAMLLVIAVALALPFTLRISRFNRFLIFWTIATFAAYTEAGEKMPWLLVNVTLPAIVLAAKVLNDIVMSIDWRKAWSNYAALLVPGVPLLLMMIWKVALNDRNEGVGGFVMTWVLLLVVGLLILGWSFLGGRIGYRPAAGVAALVAVSVLFVFSFRAGWVASYHNGDIPREMLVYTQTAPDLHDLAKEIEQTALLTGDRENLKIDIDTRDAYTWPWQWYLRSYKQASFRDHTENATEVGPDRAIAVINANNYTKTGSSIPSGFTEGRRFVHRWWFPEHLYREVTPGDFFGNFTDREAWREIADYFLYREMSSSIGSIDSYVYYSDSLPLVPTQ